MIRVDQLLLVSYKDLVQSSLQDLKPVVAGSDCPVQIGSVRSNKSDESKTNSGRINLTGNLHPDPAIVHLAEKCDDLSL
jgi:hypothetical protein